MNLLEMLIIEWMSTYAGFGLMGEQVTEAIHACPFQQAVYRTYGCKANKVQRLKCIMQERLFNKTEKKKALRLELILNLVKLSILLMGLRPYGRDDNTGVCQKSAANVGESLFDS